MLLKRGSHTRLSYLLSFFSMVNANTNNLIVLEMQNECDNRVCLNHALNWSWCWYIVTKWLLWQCPQIIIFLEQDSHKLVSKMFLFTVSSNNYFHKPGSHILQKSPMSVIEVIFNFDDISQECTWNDWGWSAIIWDNPRSRQEDRTCFYFPTWSPILTAIADHRGQSQIIRTKAWNNCRTLPVEECFWFEYNQKRTSIGGVISRLEERLLIYSDHWHRGI